MQHAMSADPPTNPVITIAMASQVFVSMHVLVQSPPDLDVLEHAQSHEHVDGVLS
jgi:hypothetical protein